MSHVDTRGKIVSIQEALRLAEAGATVVSGYFDPMTAAHARRLAELKAHAPLLVAVANPEDPLLPARARAELVAALGVVDHVVELKDGLAPRIRLEEEDQKRLERLIEHVHARQGAAS